MGQVAIVSDNTSTTLTFVDPVEFPADSTTSYQVGGVPWSWRSGWRQIADDEADNPRDLEFTFKPAARPSGLRFGVYYDHADEPVEWGYDRDSDGISVRAGDSHMTIDMQSPRGYAIQRMSGHRDPYGYGHRYLALELAGVQGVDPQRIFRIVINGAQ